MNPRAQFAAVFVVLGLAIGALVGATVSWAVKAPKASPPIPTLNINITSQQLLKRLGPPSSVTQPTKSTGGYTVIQYESHDRAPDGTPSWVANIGVK